MNGFWSYSVLWIIWRNLEEDKMNQFITYRWSDELFNKKYDYIF